MNQQDQYGRSPLHVAAAVDYAEMVEFLIQNGADIGIKTSGEGQAAMHYAAKNDAINSLHMLLGYGADIDARDSKNRTPLQVLDSVDAGSFFDDQKNSYSKVLSIPRKLVTYST